MPAGARDAHLRVYPPSDEYVKLAEDHGGDLGEPFGPLPASLVSCEPRVTCEPSGSPTNENHTAIRNERVPEEGVALRCTESAKPAESSRPSAVDGVQQ